MKVLGWISVLRYLLGRLTLDEAMSILSKRLGIRIGYVLLPFPEAAVDVDSETDWLYVQQLMERRGGRLPPTKSVS